MNLKELLYEIYIGRTTLDEEIDSTICRLCPLRVKEECTAKEDDTCYYENLSEAFDVWWNTIIENN